ncbi:MAG: VPS10 domain-containing protein [Gemmatimonadaceae bacterium]
MRRIVPVLFALALPSIAPAQRSVPGVGPTGSLDSARYAPTDPRLRGLRWRLVGPFRGGRAVAVTGDPTRRDVFYFGAVDGGVWKTTNGGQSWANLTDGKSSIASVGAIAVAPSDPNVIWVGGGEADLREDWTYGDGVWRSTDGGDSWTHLGLADARHIADIQVDPRDPDRAFVAALGHASGPNPTRGVYRTSDGGKSWQRVLYLGDSTGAIDVALDPSNPRIVYAAMWRMQRLPWGFIGGAARSGLWKSTDGGDTWTELTRNQGMPTSPVGRIGVTVSPANPRRLWATIECPPEDSTGGIYRSDDAGATWTRTSGDQKWMVRPWYYSVVEADPQDANTMYVMNLSTWRSEDGGRTFTRLRLPHGDTHALWIDPRDPTRMISGNDGGGTVSFDRGATWSTQANQPTAQFYHVTTDDQFPYRIYGAQQDNTTVSIASRSDRGSIGVRDWWPVGGGESAYIAPKPGDPNTVIAGTYTGTMTRYDHRRQRSQDISVGLNNYDGWPARDVPNRFQWTFPIFWSRHRPNELWVSANRVFRSTDEGQSWTAMSPDLTLHDPRTLGPAGGPITYDMTGTEWYATIFALAESPVRGDVMWAGSDDGLVHVTRDGAKTWTNVTPPDMRHFTRVSIIEPSHFDPGTAYVAANRYQLDDLRPYLWKTTDYGRTWRRIDGGIPAGSYTRAVREDPVRRGLLFAGTETGVWYSTNDGGAWAPLQLNLPRASVRDLHVHGGDLIAATHGRAMWVLDGYGPVLRALTDSVRSTRVHLFAPDTAVRFAGGGGFGRGGEEAGANPPGGAVFSYWLGESFARLADSARTAKLEILDPSGKVLRTYTSASAKKEKKSVVASREQGSPAAAAAAMDSVSGTSPGRQPRDTLSEKPRGSRPMADDTLAFFAADSEVTVRPGLNRFVWDLRHADTKEVKDVVNDEGTTSGPMVAPGRYTARLTAGGEARTQPFVVIEDPRSRATPQGLERQVALALQVQAKSNELADAVERILDIERQLDARTKEGKGQPWAKGADSSAKAIRDRLEQVRDSLVDIHSHADQITLHYPVRYYNMLLSLADMVQSAEGEPPRQQFEVYADLASKVDAQLARLRAIEATDLVAFNKMLREAGSPAVTLPGPSAAPVP